MLRLSSRFAVFAPRPFLCVRWTLSTIFRNLIHWSIIVITHIFFLFRSRALLVCCFKFRFFSLSSQRSALIQAQFHRERELVAEWEGLRQHSSRITSLISVWGLYRDHLRFSQPARPCIGINWIFYSSKLLSSHEPHSSVQRVKQLTWSVSSKDKKCCWLSGQWFLCSNEGSFHPLMSFTMKNETIIVLHELAPWI